MAGHAQAWQARKPAPPVSGRPSDPIGDAFDKLEKDTGKAATSRTSDLDAAFSQVESARARGMAVSVVGALDGLTRQGVESINEQERLRLNRPRLNQEIQDMIQARDEEMADYRSGLFCSGCNQTRRQILAKGDQFPHPGQRIIRPTAAQIQAKEAELQAPIDAKQREATDLERRERTCRAVIDEVVEQLESGLWLWQTAITFETNLVLQELGERMQRSRKEKEKADRQADQARAAQPRAKGPGERKQADAELKASQAQVQRVVAQQRADAEWAQQALARGQQIRTAELEKIARFLERGKLRTRTQLMATYTPSSGASNQRVLGGNFRMGRLRSLGAPFPAGEEISLVAVDRFIARFRETNSGAAIEAMMHADLRKPGAAGSSTTKKTRR